MKLKLTLIIFLLLLTLNSCGGEPKDLSTLKDEKCSYDPGIGGCEAIYYDGEKCQLINENQCQPGLEMKFRSVEECRKLCE